MNTRKIIILASIGLALFMIVPTTPANAQDCYYCNPLLFPFAVAATVVGTAAAIATAPFLSLLWTSLLRCSPSGTRLLPRSPLQHPSLTAPRHIATRYGFADIITSMGHGYLDTGDINIRRSSQLPSPAPLIHSSRLRRSGAGLFYLDSSGGRTFIRRNKIAGVHLDLAQVLRVFSRPMTGFQHIFPFSQEKSLEFKTISTWMPSLSSLHYSFLKGGSAPFSRVTSYWSGDRVFLSSLSLALE